MATRSRTLPTTKAFLPSEGLRQRRATLHIYDHSEVLTVPGPDRTSYVTGLAHFYKCSETGELRRWGFDVTFAKDDGAN